MVLTRLSVDDEVTVVDDAIKGWDGRNSGGLLRCTYLSA